MKRIQLTEEELNDIKNAYLTGSSADKIAEGREFSRTYVEKLIVKQGWSRPNLRKNFTKEQEDEIVRLYIEDGLTTTEVGELTGRASRTVWGVLVKRGVQTRDRSESQTYFKNKYDKFKSMCFLPVDSILDTPCLDSVDAQKDKFGYRRFIWKSSQYSCHRVAWELENGEIPKGLVVRHKCHNPWCCNHLHLELGTDQDNSNDCKSANRQSKEEEHAKAKLKLEDVFYILTSKETCTFLSDYFQVAWSTIYHIKTGRNWIHVSDFYNTHKDLLLTPELLAIAYRQWNDSKRLQR
jgi:hypothetical protein